MRIWERQMRHHRMMRRCGPSGSDAVAASRAAAGSRQHLRHRRRLVRQLPAAALHPAQSGSGRKRRSQRRRWLQRPLPLLQLPPLLWQALAKPQTLQAQQLSRSSSPAAAAAAPSSRLRGSSERGLPLHVALVPSLLRDTPAGGG